MAKVKSVITVPSNLKPGANGPVLLHPSGRQQRFHLRQGQLEGSCGPYCVYMAALALGALSYRQLVGVAGMPKRVAKEVHEAAVPHYFIGTDVAELFEMLAPMQDALSFRGITEKGAQLVDEVVRWLRRDALIVLGIDGRDGRWAHWVLVVGLECELRRNELVPVALLASDPDAEPSSVALWNFRISLEKRRGKRGLSACQQDGRCFTIRLTDSIAVWRKTRSSS
jgi:hypothetical protein